MGRVDEERVRRIEDLVRRVSEIPDPQSRDTAHALMEAILELHGAALESMLDTAFDSGESGKAMIRRFAADSLVASVLLLHDLHPDDLETRVHRALGKVHGSAELLGVFHGAVRVRITGSGCGLRESIEALIREAAPDAATVVIEDALPSSGFVPLASLGIAVPAAIS